MTITQEQFDYLLGWLNTDRDLAGKKYETIRFGLIKIFASKGFSDAEDLADETINRVTVRLSDVRENYVGEPAHYFRGVARNVVRERLQRKEIPFDTIEIRVDPKPEHTEEYDCLGHCLQRLPVNKRDLILDYYLYEGHEKIEQRKRLAGQRKISEGAIRSRAFQIKRNLQNCMRQCSLLKKGRQCPWRLT